MTRERPYEIYGAPEMPEPSLIVGWSHDAGKLGPGVVDFLSRKLGAVACADILPSPFFPLGGVSIEDDVIQFPESKFYCCLEKNLLIFKSETPGKEYYQFVETILDIARHYRVRELYTVGGMVSVTAHTSPARAFAVVNQAQLKQELAGFDIDTEMDYVTPDGSRPTLSSLLLWAAKRRQLAGVSLWAEVPFYLTAAEDPRACRRLLGFLDRRLKLGLDLAELDRAIEIQGRAMVELSQQSATVSKCVEMLARGIMLSQEEQERLATEVTEFLERHRS